jgi:hypothetical protein
MCVLTGGPRIVWRDVLYCDHERGSADMRYVSRQMMSMDG